MCFKINHKHIVKLRFLVLPIFIVILFACATFPQKTYEETVAQWNSYKVADKWMQYNFRYDFKRVKPSERPGPRTPEETFKLKSGVCFDSAHFLKDVLNRIDPSYEAKVVIVKVSPFPTFVHDVVCSFKKEGKLFIMMQYGLNNKLTGVNGPFNSLDEFKNYYQSNSPRTKEGMKVERVISKE
ncbi:MAG TPA: transglutaminase-like domain-containing protein [Desulfatiglandales bacterium]|nr:transglutaminase-like domain-containing protein [Desulfatiglandales bacterium]